MVQDFFSAYKARSWPNQIQSHSRMLHRKSLYKYMFIGTEACLSLHIHWGTFKGARENPGANFQCSVEAAVSQFELVRNWFSSCDCKCAGFCCYGLNWLWVIMKSIMDVNKGRVQCWEMGALSINNFLHFLERTVHHLWWGVGFNNVDSTIWGWIGPSNIYMHSRSLFHML